MKFRLYSPVIVIGKEQGSMTTVVEYESFEVLKAAGEHHGGFTTPRGHWIPWPCAFVETIKKFDER